MTEPRRGYLAWAAVLVPLWLLCMLCTHWEPVMRDGWGHYIWHRNFGSSLHQLHDFAIGAYTHNNPRLGQDITWLLFTPGPWHAIVTPLVELAMYALLCALVLGRWPALRRADDALLYATLFAMTAVTVPMFGPMLWYRPFTGNYLYGFVLDLALLVPYRFWLEHGSARLRGAWRVPVMLVLGAAAGLCNEHTDPALVAAAAVAIGVAWRRGERIAAWAIAGLVGAIAGSAALFFAPGQSIRYNALATQQSLVGRIVDRGLGANLTVVGLGVLFVLPLVGWLALGAFARRATPPGAAPQDRATRATVAALATLAGAIVLTLLASPKQGHRLYLASSALACAAAAARLMPQLVPRWSRRAAAALAALVIAFVAWRSLPAYHTLGAEFAERIDLVEHAPRGQVLELPRYTVRPSRWAYGEDLDPQDKRDVLISTWFLAGVKLVPELPPGAAPSASEAL